MIYLHPSNEVTPVSLDMVGCYAKKGGIELEGSRAALRKLSGLLESENLPIQVTLEERD